MNNKKENWFSRFYNKLIDLGTILKNSDRKKKLGILFDLLFLILITCLLKIPFIFVRDLGDNLIEALFESNTTLFSLWGLVIEFVYFILAISFFVKTFDKWFKNIK